MDVFYLDENNLLRTLDVPLSHCTYCGNKDSISLLYINNFGWRIYCPVCWLQSPYLKTRNEAIKFWNNLIIKKENGNND